MVKNNRLEEKGRTGVMRQRQATLTKWVSRCNNIGNYNNANSNSKINTNITQYREQKKINKRNQEKLIDGIKKNGTRRYA